MKKTAKLIARRDSVTITVKKESTGVCIYMREGGKQIAEVLVDCYSGARNLFVYLDGEEIPSKKIELV